MLPGPRFFFATLTRVVRVKNIDPSVLITRELEGVSGCTDRRLAKWDAPKHVAHDERCMQDEHLYIAQNHLHRPSAQFKRLFC
jgi:hypothetical protein